jgi:hypothetical protein
MGKGGPNPIRIFLGHTVYEEKCFDKSKIPSKTQKLSSK